MSAVPRFPTDSGYAGLKMSAEEFFSLGETVERYELIDGVVVTSPSATPRHNRMLMEIARQLMDYEDRSEAIWTFSETDVKFSAEKVYRPDISVYGADRLSEGAERLVGPPNLVVEVLSQGTKGA